jgi:hypothetical protein
VTVTPVDGITYWYDPAQSAFVCPGRPSLTITVTDPDPQPTGLLAGALPLGTTDYPIPTNTANVRYLSATGASDSNAGTIAAPYATLQQAINQVPTGGTIVVRGGTYHHKASVPSGKYVRIQAYPGEVVWFDGSVQVGTAWTNNGNSTWTTTYPVDFARFTNLPGTDPQRGNPDQVFVDGAAIKQSADNSVPTAGTFSVNQTANTLTIALDPAGKTIRYTDLDFFNSASGKCDLLGIGIRRYSPPGAGSNSFIGAFIYYGGTSAGSLIENCVFQDSSLDGTSLTKPDIIVRSCTFQDCGRMGVGGTQCDRILIEKCLFRRLNTGLFDQAPETGGIKLTRADQPVSRWNWFEDIPNMNAIWYDVSCTRCWTYGNYIDGRSKGRGDAYTCMFQEISDGGIYGGVQYKQLLGRESLDRRPVPHLLHRLRLHRVLEQLHAPCTRRRASTSARTGATTTKPQQQDDRDRAVAEPVLLGRQQRRRRRPQRRGRLADRLLPRPEPRHQPALPGLGHGDPSRGELVPAAPRERCSSGAAGRRSRNNYNTLAAFAASDATVGGPPGAKLGANYVGTTTPAASTGAPVLAEVATMLGVASGTRMVGPNPSNLPSVMPGAN